MLTPTEAADIARRAGLTLADAVALRMLADDTEAATSLAARFATGDGGAGFVAKLFGNNDPDLPDPDPETDDERAFVRDLFNPPKRD